MYTFETYFKTLKDKTNNMTRRKGRVIRGYMIEETGEFCVEFITKVMAIGVLISHHEDRLTQKGTIAHNIIKPPLE